MTISNTTVKAIYNGDGSNVTFAIPFSYFANSEIEVTTRDESVSPAVETVQEQGIDYTVSSYPATNIVFLTAPASTTKVLVKRVMPLTQSTDYLATGPFPAESHETALDKAVALSQQLNEKISRAVLLPATTSLANIALPEPEANKVLAWNPTATGLVNMTAVTGSLTVNITGSGGGGGGGGAVWSDFDDSSPTTTDENGEKVFLFGAGLSQTLVRSIKVPQGYTAGRPIKMYLNFYSPSSSGTVAMQTIAYLVRKNLDPIDSPVDQRSSTNSAITNTVANQLRQIEFDISSSGGAIGSTAVAAGDYIRVILIRNSDTDTADVRFIPGSTEDTFT